MEWYEIQPLIEGMHLKNKDSWEQARIIAFLIAQTNSRKQLTPSDILKFSWDKEKLDEVISQEYKDTIISEMKEIEKQLNNG